MSIDLLPQAQSITRAKGHCAINTLGPALISQEAASHICIRSALKRLGIAVRSSKNAGTWELRIGHYQGSCSRLHKKAEAYTLDISKSGLVITANDKDGLYWALSTLEQLSDGQLSDKQCTSPCVHISDYPQYHLRYHHDDISRKQISKLADFKRIIRLLSQFKIKYYTPYMEDVLYLKSNPEIGIGRGRLMPNEIKAMHQEAEKYNVTIFPTYSLIGHQENLLQLKKYRKYAQEVFQEPSAYDPRKKILRPYLKNVIKDVCESFPDSPYFHACFDEIIGLPTNVIIDHANWCAREINKHGKQMLMWIDMFKNHDAIPDLKKLDPSIIPVEWNYGKSGKEISAYIKHGQHVSGLAGYNNWCCFVPDMRLGKANIDGWCKTMKRLKGPGFGSSMWGDNGYENARDLSWLLYAYLGEATWSGSCGSDFDKRFHIQFYGKAIPALQKIHSGLEQRQLEPGFLWRQFRAPLSGLQRLLHNDPSLLQQAKEQLKLSNKLLKQCALAKTQCIKQADHIDHYEVGLIREILILKRIIFASTLNNKHKKSLQSAIKQLQDETRAVKKRYKQIWLRHNKRENIEVSLAIYDSIIDDLKQYSITEKKQPLYACVDINQFCNSNFQGVWGIPIGQRSLNNIPYQFASIQQTHQALEPKQHLSIPIDQTRSLKDMHFICAGQTSHDTKANKALLIKLYHGKKLVFSEQFKSIEDLCCWWAPRGDHMWAGGGLKYVNAKRTQFAYDCRNYHGLLHTSGFKLPRNCIADRIELSANGNETFALFALTLEYHA